jgi:hypothetical protein
MGVVQMRNLQKVERNGPKKPERKENVEEGEDVAGSGWRVPTTVPQKRSEGECTPRYMRERHTEIQKARPIEM